MRAKVLRGSLLGLIVFGAASSVVSYFTYGQFAGERGVTAQTLTAGTVALEDNDSGSTTLSMVQGRPGTPVSGCIKIRYVGTLDARVRLFAKQSGALAPYLQLKVERGASTSPFPSCAGFTPDSADYGSGPGVLYDGPLSTFPTSYEAGVPDPLNPWNAGDERVYKLSATLGTNDAAQGLAGTATFMWGAQNT